MNVQQSDSKNLYPPLKQGYSVLVVPNDQISQENKFYYEREATIKDPLLAPQVPQYAIYNPQRAIVYAKKSRMHCCAVLTCCFCTLCCCLFFLISIILGAIFATYALSCYSATSQTHVYNVPYLNITEMRFLNQFGSIIITRTDSENITISVKKSGPNTDALINSPPH